MTGGHGVGATMLAESGTALRGKAVLVAVSGVDIGGAIVAGLLDQGARVALLTDNRELLATTSAAVVIDTAFSARAAVASAFEQAIARLGAPDLVVLSALPAVAAQVKPLVELTDEEWLGGARTAIRTTLHCLQAAGTYLKPRGGAVALVGPSLGLVGCRGLVGLTTALEGQRGLMKSVARQWGHAGVTLNWIACAPRALSPVFAQAPLAIKSDAVPVALGRAVDPRTELAPVLGFLASAAGRALTGTTLTLDGGEWMVP